MFFRACFSFSFFGWGVDFFGGEKRGGAFFGVHLCFQTCFFCACLCFWRWEEEELMETHSCHLAHVTQDLTTTPRDSTAIAELAL